jgi:hypothetical protein
MYELASVYSVYVCMRYPLFPFSFLHDDERIDHGVYVPESTDLAVAGIEVGKRRSAILVYEASK